MILQIVLALLMIIFLILLNCKKYLKRNNKNDIPGPFCVPYLGYLPMFLTKLPIHVFYQKMASKYGDIFQLKIGVRHFVILNSSAGIREAFGKINLAGRPDNQPFFELIQNGGQQAFTFVSAASPLWKFHRKNTISALSLFGSSKNSRLREITEQGFCRLELQLDANLGVPFNPKRIIFDCIASIIGRINFGNEFDSGNPMLKNLLQLTEETLAVFEASGIIDCFPCLKFLFKNSLAKMQRLSYHSNMLISDMLSKHSFFEDGDNVCDIVQALQAKCKEISAEEYESLALDEAQILTITADLFQAGFMTTMESFVWALTLMAYHPQSQEKVRKELLENLNCSEFPALDDKQQTPYTEATLTEVLRYSSLVPLALPHSVIEEETVNGFSMPKGALVFANTYAVHYNPTVFQEPNRFMPERYFKNDQLDLALIQTVIPFSVGKRRCVGENLARQELYMLFCAVMKKYEISKPSGDNLDLNNHVQNALLRTLKPIDIVFRLI